MTTDKQPFLYLAPIRGITDALFREIFSRHFKGIDMAVAPFINPQGKSFFTRKLLKDVLPENNHNLAIIPQLLHTTPEPFLLLAKRLQDLGYTRINWNLGCPAPMVIKKKRGSGLLPYPEDIIRFLDEVIPKLNIELSIKTRIGYFNNEEIYALLPQLNDYPLAEIIIHARLGRQMYKGKPDIQSFTNCLHLTRHPVIYNGDITDARIFTNLKEQFPDIKGWMIGRGVLSNPTLAEEIKQLKLQSEKSRMKRYRAYHDELYHRYGERLEGTSHLLGRMKLIWSYLIHSFPGGEKEFKKIKKSRTRKQYLSVVDNLLNLTH